MALRKPTFEGQEAQGVEEPAVVSTVATETVAQDVKQPVNDAVARDTTPATVQQRTTAVATPTGGKYKPALTSYQNVIDPSSLEFDTFRRITVGLDGFSDENEVELGKCIKLQIMSWNERFVVTPGVQNAEANEKVRYSLDGKVLEDGTLVADYLKVLREVDGYDKASLKKYMTIYGFLVGNEIKGEMVEIDPAEREIVSVQVPPRSLPLFTRYQIETGVKVAQGVIAESDELVLKQEKVKGKTTTYASIRISAK